MKKTLLFFVVVLATACPASAQMSYQQWQKAIENNPYLQPRYGDIEKTVYQHREDEAFRAFMLRQFETVEKASQFLIDRGLQFIYQEDPVEAMRRFNEAYLMDSSNYDIYMGYGEIYASMGQHTLARELYLEGLARDAQNAKLLTANGNTYLAEYYINTNKDQKLAQAKLDTGIALLNRSYELEPSDGNTNYKLSICYFNKNNCQKAGKHLRIAELLGNNNVHGEYINDLQKRCPEALAPPDCSDLHSGQYYIDDHGMRTFIDRSEHMQREKIQGGFYTDMNITWEKPSRFRLWPKREAQEHSTALPILYCHVVEIAPDRNSYTQVSRSESSHKAIVQVVHRLPLVQYQSSSPENK